VCFLGACAYSASLCGLCSDCDETTGTCFPSPNPDIDSCRVSLNDDPCAACIDGVCMIDPVCQSG
jgi:hypothetical protein